MVTCNWTKCHQALHISAFTSALGLVGFSFGSKWASVTNSTSVGKASGVKSTHQAPQADPKPFFNNKYEIVPPYHNVKEQWWISWAKVALLQWVWWWISWANVALLHWVWWWISWANVALLQWVIWWIFWANVQYYRVWLRINQTARERTSQGLWKFNILI